MPIFERSKDHLAVSRMDYRAHARQSIFLGFKLIWLGLTSIIHGVIPSRFDGDAPLGVARMFYQVVFLSPNPVFQAFIAEQKKIAEEKLNSRRGER
jgi:hypothetical protein